MKADALLGLTLGLCLGYVAVGAVGQQSPDGTKVIASPSSVSVILTDAKGHRWCADHGWLSRDDTYAWQPGNEAGAYVSEFKILGGIIYAHDERYGKWFKWNETGVGAFSGNFTDAGVSEPMPPVVTPTPTPTVTPTPSPTPTPQPDPVLAKLNQILALLTPTPAAPSVSCNVITVNSASVTIRCARADFPAVVVGGTVKVIK